MATASPNPAATPAPPLKSRAGSIVVPKMTDPNANSSANLRQEQKTDSNENDVWTTERQLVSSLAKLQKLEAMIQNMRTLLPDRLLEPMIPIVNPQVAALGKTMPKSPQVLFERLSNTIREGSTEVSNFQSMWCSPELKEIWDHVGARIRENNGQLLQPTGMWERDYDVLLEQLVKDEESRKKEEERAEEEAERTQIAQSAEGDWRKIVEGFGQRNLPGVRVVPSRNRDIVTVMLAKAGMAFEAQLVNLSDGSGLSKWQVSNKPSVLSPGKPATKLETSICECLNSRPRQWDLSFLLDMIISYSSIKQTPCAKCNKMTDNAAQLPTIRQATPVQTDGQATFTFGPFHSGCI